MRRELQRLGETASGASVPSPASDHFALFGLAKAYDIDAGALQTRFRELQRMLHPDRFAQAPAAERSASAFLASRLNEAYATLRDPLTRAHYFLQLHGIDAPSAVQAALSADFLDTQIDWREDFEAACNARDRVTLDRLTSALREETRWRYDALAEDLKAGAYLSAARLVTELRFLERLAADVVEALDRWEMV